MNMKGSSGCVECAFLSYLHFGLMLHLNGLLLHPSQIQSFLGMSWGRGERREERGKVWWLFSHQCSMKVWHLSLYLSTSTNVEHKIMNTKQDRNSRWSTACMWNKRSLSVATQKARWWPLNPVHWFEWRWEQRSLALISNQYFHND